MMLMSISRIAQAANVSYATAWRIINNQSCSSQEAVQAVRAAMNQLGYVPASSARGRKPKSAEGIRTHNVALMHFREGTAISTSILSTVQGLLAERNLNLIFAQVDRPEALPQAVRAGNVDGILGYGQFPRSAITPSLERVPAVWLMSRYDDATDTWGDRIKPDHAAIGRLAALHLLARGHRDVAYFNALPRSAVYAERGGAFRRACEGQVRSLAFISAAVHPPEAPEGSWLQEAAETFVKEWLAQTPRPTGVFIPLDRLTLRVYGALARAGIQPGKDLEIVSCDNQTELLSLMHPPPASIELNRNTVARLAVERLLWRMRHGMSSPSIVVTVSPTLATPAVNGHGDGNGNGNGHGHGHDNRSWTGDGKRQGDGHDGEAETPPSMDLPVEPHEPQRDEEE